MILVALEMKLQYMYRISKASRRRDCACGAPGVISLPILERLSVKLKFNCNYHKRDLQDTGNLLSLVRRLLVGEMGYS